MGDIKTAREKAIEQKRAKRSTECGDSDDPRLQDPVYNRAKKLWGKFLRGEITSKELGGNLDGFQQDTQDEIKELFNEENI
jgi:hypothetical protein